MGALISDLSHMADTIAAAEQRRKDAKVVIDALNRAGDVQIELGQGAPDFSFNARLTFDRGRPKAVSRGVEAGLRTAPCASLLRNSTIDATRFFHATIGHRVLRLAPHPLRFCTYQGRAIADVRSPTRSSQMDYKRAVVLPAKPLSPAKP